MAVSQRRALRDPRLMPPAVWVLLMILFASAITVSAIDLLARRR